MLTYHTLFWLDVKIGALFLRLGKIDCISHFCSMTSQILSYINILNINRKQLTKALTWM